MRNGNKIVTEGSKEVRNYKLATICSPKYFGEHKNFSKYDCIWKEDRKLTLKYKQTKIKVGPIKKNNVFTPES
ncbi:hypothetical protein DPMN_037860 [Dreissena polymorpha]|uniref:Uncharacterized protein n=1 Tax=Dreissena polymorpha TaxID=45954 RepID=A0A9D4MC34_DREPO|nr:hypothetical protein DPMN_037860 [Dreissena polymorpha]